MRAEGRGARVALITGVIAGALVLVVVVASLLASRWAENRIRAELAALSDRLGRPVAAERIDVRIVGGAMLELTGLVIGPDPCLAVERDDAVRIDRVRLRIGLLRTLATLGRTPSLREALVERAVLNVVRLPDGRLNWQEIAARLASPGPARPMDDPTRARLRRARIDQLRIADAQVRFVDPRREATAEVSKVDLSAEGASLARAFDARLAAAVLAGERNLHVEARFGASPDQPGRIAPPPVERAHLRLESVRLGPMAPFVEAAVPALSGLAEGSANADLSAALPADGAAWVRGFVRLTSARFEGGRPFDARLDVDARGDVEAGSVEVRRLRASLADMTLEARGALRGLRDRPRFAGFSLASTGLDFGVIRRHYPALTRVTGLVLDGPFSVEARGTADEGGDRLFARADLSPASLAVPGQEVRKAAGVPLVLEAHARAAAETLRLQPITLRMGEWVIAGEALLRPDGEGGRGRRFEASAEAKPLPIRELVALLAPARVGEVPAVRVGARVRVAGVVGQPASVQVQVPAFSISAARSDLTGSFSATNLRSPRVTFEGRSRSLYLDDLLPRGQGDDREREQPSDRTTGPLARASGSARLRIERGRAANIDFRDLRAEATLDRGRVVTRVLEVSALGGTFSGAGTEWPLAGEGAFRLRGSARGMDVAALLGRFADRSQVLGGRLHADLDLRGRSDGAAAARTLTGTVGGRVESAELLSSSLLRPIIEQVGAVASLPPLRQLLGGAQARAARLGDRQLGDVSGTLRFADGAVLIERPLEARAPFGPLSLAGRVGLDRQLDLRGTLWLEPDAASALLGGRGDFGAPVPIELRITGPLASPRIRPEAPTRVAAALTAGLARGITGPVPPAGVDDRAGRKPPDDARRRARELQDEAERRLRGLLP